MSSLRQLTINKFGKVPNDQYACTNVNCNLVPEIMNVDFESGKIQIRCLKHGDQIK